MRVDYDKIRFLIIDDNAFTRRLLRTLLYSFGARFVSEAIDGTTGFEAFQAESPDLVLLDWEMPMLDGLDVTKMMRHPSESHNPFVAILMVTAHTTRQHVRMARDAGITEFIAKPIAPQSVYDKIHAAVAEPRPFIRTLSYFGPDRRRGAPNLWRGPDRRNGEKAETFAPRSIAEKASIR